MMKSHEDFFKIIFLSTLAAVIAGGYIIWSKKFAQINSQWTIPKKWRKVGTISKIYLFPLKSGKYISLDAAICTITGLREEDCAGKLSLKDRTFVVFDEVTREKITIREYPKMLLIEIRAVDEDTVVFSSPGSEDLEIKVPDGTNIKEDNNFVILWHKQKVGTVDCGEEASNWFTNILTEGRKNCRLGYYIKDVMPQRSVKNHPPEKRKVYKMDDDSLLKGVYSDLSSYMIMTQASVDDLNSRLANPVTEINFRPNIFVEDTEAPYEEDNWGWLKLGEDTVLRRFKHCTRCLVTTTDPVTAIRDPSMEPLKTLRTYRISRNPEIRKLEGQKPLMGINMSLHKTGVIRVGDPVFANCDE